MAQLIQWVTSAQALRAAAYAEPRRARALVIDLRDGAALELLRPAPTASDYLDERRPGASARGYFLARRAATRSCVALALDCDARDVVIGYDAAGAPRVRSPAPLEISVAGRGPFAAIATAPTPVGVDLELFSAPVEIIDDVLHASERAALAQALAADRGDLFMRMWTAKEAYLKALGAGLTIDPAQVAARIEGQRLAAIEQDGVERAVLGGFFSGEFEGRAFLAACLTLQTDFTPPP